MFKIINNKKVTNCVIYLVFYYYYFNLRFIVNIFYVLFSHLINIHKKNLLKIRIKFFHFK